MNTEFEGALVAPDPQTSRRLFQFGLVALATGIVLLGYRSEVKDSLLLLMGALVTVLSALPALNWARKGDLHFPVFEMFMLTSIPFYAVPLLGGHPGGLRFSDAATWEAALGLLLFQVAAIAMFQISKGRPIRSRILTTPLLPASALRHAQVGLWLNSIYLYVYTFVDIIPYEFVVITRAIFFGIGTVSLFIQMRRWGAGELPPIEKAAVIFNVVVQLLILFRALYLIVGISVLLLALIGFVSTSRRIPIVAIAILLPIIAILHNGKTALRKQYWTAGAPLPTVVEMPGFFVQWFEAGLQPRPDESEEEDVSLAGRLFERASLFQMLCLVTERTPTIEPFLLGESYSDIPAQLVPSFLWPNKPSSLLSNVLLAVHYKLVPESNPTSVSIAFGMIAEAYANFGLIGCVLLGVVLGYGYKRLTVAAVGLPQFSALGLITILLAAWSFQVEQIFATWLISMIQAAAVVIGGPIAFRILFGAG